MFDEVGILQLPARLKKKRLAIAPIEYFFAKSSINSEPNNPILTDKLTKDDLHEENSQEKSRKNLEKKEQPTQKKNEDQSILKTEFTELSIKSFLKKNDEKPKENLAVSTNDDFSDLDLKNAWTEFLKSSNSTINIATKSVLENIIVEKLDKQHIKILSPSYSSQNEFEEISESFMIFLRQKINNKQVIFLYEIKEDTNTPAILSKEEIYKKMLSKNKNLEILRKKLGLDFN